MNSKYVLVISLAVVAAGIFTLTLQNGLSVRVSESRAAPNSCIFNSCWGTDETDQCEGGDFVIDNCGECYVAEPIYENTIQCPDEYETPTCFTGNCTCVQIPNCST